jgi:cysteine desulfurase
VCRLQRRLWDGLGERVPCLRFNGPSPGPDRLATNVNFCVEFVEGEGLLLLCDMNGIAVASGSGCVSKSLSPAPVLEAIGVPPSLARGNLILSLGRDNTEADADHFLDVFADKVVPRLRGMSPAWEQYQRGERDSLTAPRQTPDSSTS